MTILDQHVHMPDARPKQPHRLVALDGWHLRCIDCQQTLDLRSLGSQTPTTTRRGIPGINDLGACPLHVGQWRDACGPCRSEHLAQPDDQAPPITTPAGADPRQNPDWLAMREQLANRKETR